MSQIGDSDWDQEFHVWRMDWDEKQIKLFLDDRLLNTIDVEKSRNSVGRHPKHPFKQPHYILLNMAIGGTKGGKPVPENFPASFQIDYVRVYQRTKGPDSAPKR